MKICPNCGKQCIDQSVQCPKCKTELTVTQANYTTVISQKEQRRCRKCGKKKLFVKLNSEGLCPICATNEEYLQLQNHVSSLKSDVSNLEQLKKETQAAALIEIENEISSLMARKQSILTEIEQKDVTLKIKQDDIQKSNADILSFSKKLQKLKELYKSMNYSVKRYNNNETSDFTDDLINEVCANLSPAIELKLNCMNTKQLRSLYNSNYKAIKQVLEKYADRYTTKANVTIYKLMIIALEAELQNILFDLRFGTLDSSIESIKTVTQKYYIIATDGNQSIAPTIKKFIGEIEYFFIEAIKIEYEYYTQKERIKAEQRELREQMRQEAEERRLLENQRKQIEKEEEKYKNEVANIQQLIKTSTDSEKILQLESRIRELTEQLSIVSEKKDEIIKLQNGKAGYVYIISNLGSFGDNVFKVGMTRRLEPMDRVKELGDASVPFAFDVHSFIFSDDAVSLERNMHLSLHQKRVNKINLRKEFFNVSVDEIEDLVYSLEPTAEFNKTMLAEQYNQSLSVSEIGEDFAVFNEDDDKFEFSESNDY